MDPIDSLHPPREHYRESCDNCAKSKVRCGKEQPWCQRCVRRGQVCSYSPSQRPRKRALSATAHSDPELKMRRTGTPPCFGGMGSGARSRSYTHTDKPDHAGMGAFGDPDTWGPCPVFSELFGGTGTGAGSGSGSGASTNSLASNNNANFTWLSGIESLGAGGDGADVFMLPSGSGMGTPAIGDTDNSSNASCEDDLTARERDRQHCEVDVVAALAKLQGPLLSCRGDTKTTGNLGTILAASRSALSCAFKTVECTCKPNDNVALLVTTLLLRILTWYDIVLDNCRGPQSGSPEEELSHDHDVDDEHDGLRRGSIWEERDATENMQQEGNGGSHLFVPPMTIGAYELDAENRERIIGHVLLSELNKMGRLLTSFSQRFCDPQSLSLSPGSNDSNNKSQLYMAVEMFIRNKHSATVLAARKKLEAK